MDSAEVPAVLAAPVVGRARPVKLDQIDGHQKDVKQEHRVDMRQQTIKGEQNIARERQPPERPDRIHAEAYQNGQRSSEAKYIQPAHLFLPECTSEVRERLRQA